MVSLYELEVILCLHILVYIVEINSTVVTQVFTPVVSLRTRNEQALRGCQVGMCSTPELTPQLMTVSLESTHLSSIYAMMKVREKGILKQDPYGNNQ